MSKNDIMEEEQEKLIPIDENLLKLLWPTSTSSNFIDDFYVDDSIQSKRFEPKDIFALNKELSQSAPDLAIKFAANHYMVPQRLCKSADTLLPCRKQHQYKLYRGPGGTTRKRIRGNPKYSKGVSKCCESYTEFNNYYYGGQCKNIPTTIPDVERKVLYIGNMKQRTAPLDYTLCLADHKTNWNATEQIADGSTKLFSRLSIDSLANSLAGILIGYGILRETTTGSILAQFTNLDDMDRAVRLPLAKIFGTKVKSWRILSRCQGNLYQSSGYQHPSPKKLPQYTQPQHSSSAPSHSYFVSYRRYLIAPDIPDTVPAPEIQNALRFQGLRTGQVWRHKPRGFSIEVLRPCDYDRLCRDGVNFFNVAAFPVYASIENLADRNVELDGKWPVNKSVCLETKAYYASKIEEIVPDIPLTILQETQHRENIQCFKCQRYGHKATHCKYWTRCVRCGGKHKVADCDISMASARCCLCKGAHHAASHECPVHNVHSNAVQVAFAMARTKLKSPSSYGFGGTNW